jgi:hypothetical protein
MAKVLLRVCKSGPREDPGASHVPMGANLTYAIFTAWQHAEHGQPFDFTMQHTSRRLSEDSEVEA